MKQLTVVLLCIVLISFSGSVKFNIDAISELPMLLNEGKQQLEVLTTNSKAPQYGECWSNAVSSLQVGCRFITQELQSSLALRLTDCFLQMSGQDKIACDAPWKECLKKLSDRQFNAYTEFYTHTQNICYFLQSKLWHEESEKTIDRLSTTSYKVSQQLMEAEKSQEALLLQQKASLNMQEDMAKQMETSKDTMKNMMEELRVSAMDQQVALSTLFQQLATLQSWAVGELSWFGSVFFYSSTAVISCLFSSAARTRRARLPLLTILTVNYVVERYICGLVNTNNDDINQATSEIQSWVWFFRKISIALCCIVLVVLALTYWDYHAINYKILMQIRNQNAELLKRLKYYGDVVDSGKQQELLETFEEKLSKVTERHGNCRSISEIRETRELSVVREIPLPEVFDQLPPRKSLNRKTLVPMDRKGSPSDSYSECASEISNASVRRSTRFKRPVLSPV